MAAFPIPTPATTLNPSASLNFLKPSLLNKLHFAPKLLTSRNGRANRNPLFMLQCTKFSTPSLASETETEEDYNSSEEEYNSSEEGTAAPVNRRRRRRYRKEYPGEKKGITEEMRFVAMKLRNSGKPKEVEIEGTWQPSLEGFLKYLVDTKLVFTTIERIVDDSTDVSCMYFLYLFYHGYSYPSSDKTYWLASITFIASYVVTLRLLCVFHDRIECWQSLVIE